MNIGSDNSKKSYFYSYKPPGPAYIPFTGRDKQRGEGEDKKGAQPYTRGVFKKVLLQAPSFPGSTERVLEAERQDRELLRRWKDARAQLYTLRAREDLI